MKRIAVWMLTLALCLSCVAIGEAKTYNGLPLPSWQPDTITCRVIDASDGMNDRENAENLFDGDVKTKWCAKMEDELYVVFMLDEPISLEKYTIVTANDNTSFRGRNPEDWALFGANLESTAWEPVHAVKGDTTLQDENYAAFTFTLDEPSKAYNVFLLLIADNRGDRCMQMSEFIPNDLWTCQAVEPAANQEQDFDVTPNADCKTCGGDGRISRSCGSCFGSGKQSCMSCGGDGKSMCLACDGRGYMRSDHSNCFSCSGGYKSCFSCSGSGKRSCSSCSGRGTVQSVCPDCAR